MGKTGRCGRFVHLLLRGLVLLGVAMGGVTSAHADEQDAKDAAFEKQVTDEIAAQSPEAARVFAEATSARDRQDGAGAKRGYQRVTELLPSSDHAYRRLCGLELADHDTVKAMADCRRALALRASPYNRVAMANALISSPEPSTAELKEAAFQAETALEALPDDPYALSTAVQVDMTRQDGAAAEKHAMHFRDVAPHSMQAHILLALVYVGESRWDAARAEALEAKKYGFPEAGYQNFLKIIDEHEHSGPAYWAMCLGVLFVVWAACFAALLGAGALLSRLVMRAAERMSGMAPGDAQRVELAPSSLRRLYKAVIGLTCVYFYASLPLVIVGVLVAAGAVIYGMLAMGYVAIKLVLIVCVVAAVSLIAVFKAMWAIVASRKQEDPGEPLDLEAEPKLRALLQEVADRVGTRRVDRVFVTTGTDLAVTERGGGLFRLGKDTTERCLIVGAAVLEGMPLRAFKAVLAHEYGHFKNEDTAGGGLALTMNRSLLTMIIALARGGAAAWYSPAWWFVRGFERVFLRISLGASRLQEILADRWAAMAYGSASFERGLRHVIDRTVRFNAHAGVALKEHLEKKLPLANFYKYEPETPVSEQDLAEALEKALGRPASEYDSHPPPNQRIAWVHAMQTEGDARAAEDDEGEAWSLFGDRTKLEEQMTQRIHASLVRQGIILPLASSN